jgi:hypothetical protein
MIKIIIFITDNFYKQLSGSKNSNDIGKGFSLVAFNLSCHLLVLVKLITRIESLESIGLKNETVLLAFIFFSISLSLLFSFLTSRNFLNKCIFKYKKNALINNTGSVVFALYFFANMYLSIYILIWEITIYSYLFFIILPLLFYIYCKMIDRNVKKNEKVSDA